MSHGNLRNYTLKVWRQAKPGASGKMTSYTARDISPESSFLEMLDQVNEQIILDGGEPIAFDHDCREGICGTCSMVINGIPHGPDRGTTACQLHMRRFSDGDVIHIEPWRATAFPVIRDLIVDRGSFDRIIQSGGYVSVPTGGAPDANAVPISKGAARESFDSAACIGCGACVAACPNASAMLFVGAKVSQFIHLPQGQPERRRRALNMVDTMDAEGFGNCTNHGECSTVCPKEIPLKVISELNREYLKASLLGPEE